ncbi:MAG: hypothetical protein M3082_03605 [Candidatus Dormibacteraeota bacterium]|nr:hypothetical protein [Candidatus Dormibacteraeota bacterium]
MTATDAFAGRHWRWGALAVALAAQLLLLAQPAAAANRCSLTDPVGDTFIPAPGFQDIVGAQISRHGDRLLLQMTVANPVPRRPDLAGAAEIWWFWPIQTDPNLVVYGYPHLNDVGLPFELVPYVAWDGTSFRAALIDRRPMVTGGKAVITPVPFRISGRSIKLWLHQDRLGLPSTFGWTAATGDWLTLPPSNTDQLVDVLDAGVVRGPC